MSSITIHSCDICKEEIEAGGARHRIGLREKDPSVYYFGHRGDTIEEDACDACHNAFQSLRDSLKAGTHG